ncbi:MAG: hypothetical protein LBK00_09845, partial [Treponema sp.]|nr:hypothetical protein [Treponema sp.]
PGTRHPAPGTHYNVLRKRFVKYLTPDVLPAYNNKKSSPHHSSKLKKITPNRFLNNVFRSPNNLNGFPNNSNETPNYSVSGGVKALESKKRL